MEIDYIIDKEIDYMTNIIYNDTALAYDEANKIAKKLHNLDIKPTLPLTFGKRQCSHEICKKCLLSVFDSWCEDGICHKGNTPREVYNACKGDFGAFEEMITEQLDSPY